MEQEPLFVVPCQEKTGMVNRAVYPFRLTRENAIKFWEAAKQFPKVFNNIPTNNPAEFLDNFVKWDEYRLEAQGEALIWIVDDFVGAFTLSNIYHPYDALMHFTFFDKRFRGRAPLVREMITYVFDTYGFYRLSAEIPAFTSSGVLKFVTERIGLVFEGRRRKAIEYKEDLFDVLLYGITKEDIETWEPQRLRQLEEVQLNQ